MGRRIPHPEEKAMKKQDKVSMQRRRVLKAGSAGMLAPAAGMAATDDNGTNQAQHPFGAGDSLVLSGSLKADDGRLMGGHPFQLHSADSLLARGISDGAGRFVLQAQLPARPGALALHIAGAAPQKLTFSRNGNGMSRLDRDGDGIWRAAVGITFA
jgi:hypothetical protein